MPQVDIRSLLSRDSVSRTISNNLGVDSGLRALAGGLIEPGDYMPKDPRQYAQFRRFLHDVFCFSLIDNGLFQGYEISISDLNLNSNSKKLKTQKPDLYRVAGDKLHIGELSCSYSPEKSYKTKEETYKELIEFYKSSGFEVTYDIFIVDLSDPEWDLTFPKISELYKTIIHDLLDSLRVIHSNPSFNSLRKQETGMYSLDRMDFQLEKSTIIDLVEEATGVREKFSKIEQSYLSQSTQENDDYYIDSIAMSILNDKVHSRPTPTPESIIPKTLISDFTKMKNIKPTTIKSPVVLQMGLPSVYDYHYMSFDDVIGDLRKTTSTGGYLTYIKSSLEQRNPDDTHIISLSITDDQLEIEQLQGPGRKSYLKRNGLHVPRKEPTHIGISESHILDVNHLIDDVESINVTSTRILELPSIEVSGLTSNIEMESCYSSIRLNSTTAMLQFYQYLSREITLSSMRRRNKRQYALGYSMCRGIYFLIAPGPQLRTESNVEFVKIISLIPPIENKHILKWLPEGDHWESQWFSVDIDRLKQWQRSFDRVFLSTLVNAERLTRPGLSFKESVNQEVRFKNYALLSLVFLENKQLTSTTNQTIRYLWMKSLGDKEFDGILNKFPSRINSILQSFMLQRAVSSCISICQTSLPNLVNVNQIVRDEYTGGYDESTTGVANLLPRLFTFGPPCPISYNLNEIYWCVSYNKDRQNPTQDSMNILGKILKEENLYDNELKSRNSISKVDYLFGNTTIDEDIKHIRSQKPESHFYSRRAIECGIRLQDVHHENQGDRGSWLTNDKLNKILSKNLSEYATFKASVKTIASKINPLDLSEVTKIGRRTKAIELIAEIVQDENLQTALDVVMSYSGNANQSFKIIIQIFKKNQIGGVREIIILFIKARILFNIVEEVARLMSKSDKREILTKGRDKRLMMRGDYEEITSSFPDGTPLKIVKESYDMTTWAQKFIPTIFIPLFDYHFKTLPGMSDLARFIFLKHSNKQMEYPKKLIEQWIKHPLTEHKEPWIQKCKENFFKTGEPWFYNHSNMCQGIPHYNSTTLALCAISLRDALFDSCIRQLKTTKAIHWKTRVGSDDKGTIIGIDMSKEDSYRQYILLGQCERAAERLFSMELSVKSASGHLMYELNSAYMSNLETLSPTIKFSLAAVDMIGTTSCTSFVNESYGRIRQMRENGVTSIVCGVAHAINSQHFYDMFSTGNGQINDVTEIFKVRRDLIPYDFGVYPMYDIDVQDIVGPEFYNYRIFKSHPNEPHVQLLYTSISKETNDEIFLRETDELLKKDHFGISQGLVRQLSNMRDRLKSNGEEVIKFFDNNPFMIVRGPETIEETKYTILSKLYTKGASEALRRTSPAIYIGRLSAFKSAKSWNTPLAEQLGINLITGEVETTMTYIKSTYKEFIQKSVEIVKSKEGIDLTRLTNIIFPHNKSLDIVETLVGKFGAVKSSNKKYSQAVRTWTVNNFNYEFTSSLKSILQTSFGESHESSIEDVNEMKSLFNIDISSLNKFVNQCQERNIRPIDMFYYMSKVHKNTKTSRIQAFGSGPSTNSLHMTLTNIKRYNHMPNATVVMDHGVEIDQLSNSMTLDRRFDNIKLYYNLMIMNKLGFMDGYIPGDTFWLTETMTLEMDCLTTIRMIRSINGYDQITQKTLKLVASMLLEKDELKEKLISWKSLNYTYLRKQKRTIRPNGQIQWTGDLSVLVSSENDCYTIDIRNGVKSITTKSINDLSSIYRSLKEMSKTLSIEMNDFFRLRELSKGDIYLSQTTKFLHISEVDGVRANKLNLRIDPKFQYKRLTDLESFKVVTNHNKKTGEIQIFLQDRHSRTSNICHSNGNFYPVEIPNGFYVAYDCNYLGVNLRTLLSNRSWFYNYRLPVMTTSERIEFLKSGVDLKKVMLLENIDRQRISDYVEARNEVNEDSFPSLTAPTVEVNGKYYEPSKLSSKTINELFRQTIDKIDMPEDLKDQQTVDWADEMNEIADKADEMDNKFLETISKETLTSEDHVGMIKALSYKKKQGRSMFTISSLQQGGLLKTRILDCFFSNQSIGSERQSQLPNMYLWLKTQSGRYEEIVLNELKLHIITRLSRVSGSNKSQIKNVLDSNTTHYSIPISILDSIINNINPNQADLFETIMNDDFNDEIESDSGLSSNDD